MTYVLSFFLLKNLHKRKCVCDGECFYKIYSLSLYLSNFATIAGGPCIDLSRFSTLCALTITTPSVIQKYYCVPNKPPPPLLLVNFWIFSQPPNAYLDLSPFIYYSKCLLLTCTEIDDLNTIIPISNFQ